MSNSLTKVLSRCSLPEQLIYLITWVIVFLFPIVSSLLDSIPDGIGTIYWDEIFRTWRDVFPLFLLFLVNHYLLLPYLFFRKRIMPYILSALLCSLLFLGVATLLFPDQHPRVRGDNTERIESNFPPPGMAPSHRKEPLPEWHKLDTQQYPPIKRPILLPFMRGSFIGRVLIALLMLCFNVAVKLFFKSLKDDEVMKELTRHNLQSELEYLKYQLNPHFFMNTLNNIHALVDIDTEKAKQTIVELSRLMRYVLYEANNKTISLKKEVDFLQHYVELMRIRYTDSVSITFHVSSELGNIQVPPLLLVSFVENAFKHGASYQHPSYIVIKLGIIEGELVFHCVNSNFGKEKDQHHGIGLENIKKRLQLLFDDQYNLSIRNEEEVFEVILSIPITCT